MSGVVSYDLFVSRVGTSETGFTSEGGFFVTYINDTGSASVKGTIVIASTDIDDGVMIAPANTVMPIGVIYESGIADGFPVKVVISGKAQVLLKSTETATHGYWCGVSDTAGRMYQASNAPSTTEHNREIGHSIQSNAVPGSLSYVNMHFN